MPVQQSEGGVTAAAVEAALPRTYFVKRGDVQQAFGLTKDAMASLVKVGTFRAVFPVKDGYARFVRSQIVAVAKRWEAI